MRSLKLFTNLCALFQHPRIANNTNYPRIIIAKSLNLSRELSGNCPTTMHDDGDEMEMTPPPAEEMRAYLHAFEGGAVTVCKDPTHAGLAIITIDNPEKRNAMSGRMMVELHDRIRELEEWREGKAVIVCGTGSNFCSGGDLDFARATGTPRGASIMNAWMVAALQRLSALPMISVCVVHGPTLGGGTEIALACDYILAGECVSFGLVHARVGIVTAWGGGTRLVHRVGPRRALDLMLTTRLLNAGECIDMGIADAIITAPSSAAAADWLRSRTQHHHTLTRGIKTIITAAAAAPHTANAFAVERRIFVPLWGGALNKAALERRVKHVRKSTEEEAGVQGTGSEDDAAASAASDNEQ